MFEIRTSLGVNFGSFRDLYKYMQEENIQKVDYTTYWVMEKVTTAKKVTIEQIEKILQDAKEIDKQIKKLI